MRGQVFIAAAAVTAGLLAAQPASAQQYRSYHDEHVSRYEQCERSERNRSIGGAIIGGIAGALLGREVADRGVRGEGAVLGSVVGATVGAGIGRATAECDTRVQGRYDPYNGAPQRTPYSRNDGYYGEDLYGGPDYREANYRRGQCRYEDVTRRDRRGRRYTEEVLMCRGRDGVWRPEYN